MALPAILAALGRVAGGAGGASSAAASRVPTLTGWQTKPPPVPGSQAHGQQKQAAAMEKNIQQTTQLVDGYNRASAAGFLMKHQIEGAFAAMAGAATMAATSIKAMADPLMALTALSNPAAVKQFELAFADAMAVMGRVALPVVEALTRAMRVVGDMYARMEPYLLRVTTAMAEAIDKIFGKLEQTSKIFGPMIDYATKAFSMVIKYVGFVFSIFAKVAGAVGVVIAEIYGHISKLIQIVEQMGVFQIIGAVISTAVDLILIPIKLVGWALGQLGKAFTWFAKLLGFKIKGPESDDKSARGSAVRSVNITSDAEAVAKDAQTKAFMQAMQPEGAKPETEVDLLKLLGTALTDLRDRLIEELDKLPQKLKDLLMELVNLVISKLPKVPGTETVKDMRDKASNVVGRVANALESAMSR